MSSFRKKTSRANCFLSLRQNMKVFCLFVSGFFLALGCTVYEVYCNAARVFGAICRGGLTIKKILNVKQMGSFQCPTLSFLILFFSFLFSFECFLCIFFFYSFSIVNTLTPRDASVLNPQVSQSLPLELPQPSRPIKNQGFFMHRHWVSTSKHHISCC